MSLFAISAFLQTIVEAGTHILFGTLGGIMNEKVGNLNLGIEGMMLLGAVGGFLTALKTGNPFLAVLASGICGLLGALIYAFTTVTLRANQVVAGLALTTLGIGISNLFGAQLSGQYIRDVSAVLGKRKIPVLSKIPILGKVFFEQSPFVFIAVVIAVLLFLFYKYTRLGLNTRMVGENPAAADASGINVLLYKYINIMAGGFLCGIGGGYFSMVYVKVWQNNLTAGAGWIAVALVIFSIWNPLRAIFGAYLFGFITGLGMKLQGGIRLFGKLFTMSSQLIGMFPYITTVIVLIMITKNKNRENQPPESLSTPYFREER